MFCHTIILLLLISIVKQCQQQTVTVQLSDGSHIRGTELSINSVTIRKFLGLPFAHPPVGSLRFAPPQALNDTIGNSSTPFLAHSLPPSCYYWPRVESEWEKQNAATHMWWNNTEMSEDCLYLNIWTPSVNASSALPVMVWIYGGGYYAGSSILEVYNGSVLAARGNVVVVSMQYRTGALGFMYLDGVAPGNVGLLDQRLAMQWVQDNIVHFGGDPRRVTIFGESAGAGSVGLHLLSPGSQGLFHHVIMQSGSPIAWWSYENSTVATQKTKKLASLLGCTTNSNDALMSCLRDVTPSQIQDHLYSVMTTFDANRASLYKKYWKDNAQVFAFIDIPFKPVYGTDFLPDLPANILTSGKFNKTDVMMGVTKDEGTFWILYALESLFRNGTEWNIPFWWNQPMTEEQKSRFTSIQASEKSLDPLRVLARYFVKPEDLHPALTKTIGFEYQIPNSSFGFDSWTASDVFNAIDDVISDYTFKCPVIDFAEEYLNRLKTDNATGTNRVWMYSFEHKTIDLPLPDWVGAMHGYEIEYAFGLPHSSAFTHQFYNFTDEEKQLSDKMLQMWTNFAKFGDPTGGDADSWPAYTQQNRTHIRLLTNSNGAIQLGADLRRRECLFWKFFIEELRNSLDAENSNCNDNSVSSASSNDALAVLLAVAAVTSIVVPSWKRE